MKIIKGLANVIIFIATMYMANKVLNEMVTPWRTLRTQWKSLLPYG